MLIYLETACSCCQIYFWGVKKCFPSLPPPKKSLTVLFYKGIIYQPRASVCVYECMRVSFIVSTGQCIL